MGNVEVRKNEEGYELNLNTLIYSELLMSNARFLVTNQGTQAQFSCKTTANPDLWDTKGGRMIGKSMQALEVNGYSAHVYDMEVIIAIALQMDTYQALLFRQWFISKVVNRKDCQAEQVKHEYLMIIVMNGTRLRGAS